MAQKIFFFVFLTVLNLNSIKLSNANYLSPMSIDPQQLTHGEYGHFMNETQCFSKDGQWIAYDTRNSDGDIASTGCVEIVNIFSGEVRSIYHTKNQTAFGPGVGAVSFSPVTDTVIFIHGIRNANESNPYGFTRRTGVAIDINNPQQPIFMDARDITIPYTAGALRGGTHAHHWSGDGEWISFTYNDYVIEQAAKTNTSIQDLRMVGVMFPGIVKVDNIDGLENNNGEMYAVIISNVKEKPKPGTDEIDRAFDECWIGKNGYQKKDGRWQTRAIAFQGNVIDINGIKKTQIFVVDLPSQLSKKQFESALPGTETERPFIPEGIHQRRISFLTEGVGGPRHWLKSTPDGKKILFLSKDKKGNINVFGISPNGGEAEQISFHEFDIQSGINISPNGKSITYIADNLIYITDIKSNKSKAITSRFSETERPVTSVHWSPDSKIIAFNKYVKTGDKKYLQIFLIPHLE